MPNTTGSLVEVFDDFGYITTGIYRRSGAVNSEGFTRRPLLGQLRSFMARLRGTGLGAGMAMGTAAVVRMRTGVPLMPEAPPRITAMVAQRRLTETPEVVVVAEDLRTALVLSASLPWATVVGIAVERDDPDAAIPSVPTVVGLPGLMRAAVDDVLILVDATRGVALIDPDPIYLAQYTAEHDRVAPKNRIYLDEAHLPAQTLDGRTLSVVAATDGVGVAAALASGPDALYHVLPLSFDPDDVRRHLAEVVAIAAGKPLIVPFNPSLPLTPLLEAASYADITLALSPSGTEFMPGGGTIAGLLREIELAQAECAERDVLFGTPRIAADISAASPDAWPPEEAVAALLEGAAAAGATRLIFCGSLEGDALHHLSALTAAASVNLMPVTFYLNPEAPSEGPEDTEKTLSHHIRLLIGAGVSAFLVSAESTQACKAIVRTVSLSECEEELARNLATSELS